MTSPSDPNLERLRYQRAWKGYRWRLAFFATVPALVLVSAPFLAEVTGKAIYSVLLLGSLLLGAMLHNGWRCPRCTGRFFFDWPLVLPTARRCVHCGLPKWATGPGAPR
jgi:hypothetical protein